MIKQRLYILFVILFSSISLAVGQSTSFTVNHSDEIYAKKPFVIQYVYKGSQQPSNFQTPKLPSDFQVLYGPAKSVSAWSSMVNGRASSNYSITYTYTILVENSGDYKIPPTSIEDETGKVLSCSTTTIKVLPNPQNPQKKNNSSSTEYKPAAFVPVLSKKSVYIYEPVYMFMRIYHLFNEARPAFDKYPIFNGFMNELLSDGSSDMGTIGVDKYNGRNYKTITFGKCLLIPTQTGKLKVGPITTDLSYTIPSNDPDDFFSFGSQVVTKKITSSIANLEVKPLPENGKPQDFTGLVGSFSASLSPDKSDFKTGEAITFKLNIKGVGYLKPINIVPPSFPKSFDVYDPTSNYKEEIRADGVYCSKDIEYVVVPNEVGMVTIPDMEINYFDPNTGTYKIAHTSPISINILKGANVSSRTVVSDANKSVFIESLLTSNRRIDKELEAFHSIVYWFIYIVILLLGLLAYALVVKYRADRSDMVSFNASRANSIARKRLKLAMKYAKEVRKDDFYEEIMKSLWQYASYKLKISQGEINMEKAIEGFSHKGLTEVECNEFRSLIEISEAARFSGVQTQADLNKVYERSADFIAMVENKKKR